MVHYCISNHSDFLLIALSQDNLKRRLAFSTIGQLGYIVLGAAIATDRGQGGAVLHIAMHACGKITLFFCAGAIFVATGKICKSTSWTWTPNAHYHGCFYDWLT